MVEAAIGDDPRFELSTLEVSRAGPSYTVDTLRQLAEVYGQGSLSLLIGSDQFRAFARWKDPETVVDLAQLAVVSRAGETVEPTDLVPEHRFRRVEVTRIDISSTQIRRKIQTGRSVRHMVPDPVLALIESNNLYRS